MSASVALADALNLARLAPSHLANRASVPLRIAANAMSARPVAAVSYLKICRAINFDPTPTLKAETPLGLEFDFQYLGIALRVRRGVNNHSDREAAKVMGIGASTVCRVERGEPVQIGSVFRICNYLGVHPFGYMR